MATAVGALDDAIREYLVYRGFTNTLKQFETEKKDDKDKNFRVNRIVDHLLQCISRSDFGALQQFWIYMNKRFFSRLSHESLVTVHRLETGVLRMFLVHASRQARHDVVKDFFEKMSEGLHDRKEWKDWFALPFTKSPEQHPTFKVFFSKDWADTFVVTLHNFFSTLFSCLPLPALLNFEAEHQKMQALSTENHHLHNQLASTKQALAEAESTIQKMEARLAQQVAAQAKRSYSNTVSTPSPAKVKVQSTAPTTQGKSGGGWKKKIAFGGSKARGASSLDETNSSGATATGGGGGGGGVGGEKQTQEQMEVTMEKQFSEPIFTKLQPGDAMSKLKQLVGAPVKQTAAAAEEKGQQQQQQQQQQHPSTSSSPDTPDVIDESSVRAYSNPDGGMPFIPLSQDTYNSHSAPVTHCKFSPTAKNIATADTDGVLKVWDPNKLETLATTEVKSSLLSLDWAPQSDHLVLMGSGDGVVKMFDAYQAKALWEVFSEPKFPKILSIACGPSTATFAFAAAASSSSHLMGSSLLTSSLTSPGLPSSRVLTNEMTQFSRPGVMGRGSSSSLRKGELPTAGGVFIWDLKTQKQKCSLPLKPLPVGVHCMAFNHNSNLLITGGADGMIRLFDVFQQECLCGWKAHGGEVFNVQFSSDETSVYSIGRDNNFCKWGINRSGEKIVEFKIHEHASNPTEGRLKGQYYPDIPRGNLFAFESEDKFVLTCGPQEAIVYQVGLDGSLTKSLSMTSQSGPVTCVDWLQGARSMSTCITASLDGSVYITGLLRSMNPT